MHGACRRAGGVIVATHHKSGYRTLKRCGEGSGVFGGEFFTLYRGNGSGEVFFLYRSISDNHHFVKCVVGFGHFYLQVIA